MPGVDEIVCERGKCRASEQIFRKTFRQGPAEDQKLISQPFSLFLVVTCQEGFESHRNGSCVAQ